MIAGILAFLQALPEFVKLMNRLGLLLDRFMKWSDQHGIDKWITDLETSIDQLEQAQTAQEKLAAAKSIDDAIRRLK